MRTKNSQHHRTFVIAFPFQVFVHCILCNAYRGSEAEESPAESLQVGIRQSKCRELEEFFNLNLTILSMILRFITLG